LRFVGPALDAIHGELISLQQSTFQQNNNVLPLNKAIILKHIYYKYPNASQIALKDICLNIPAHSTVGLVGTTGSGKTTLVDLILGLLEAKEGTLEVDNQVICEENRRSWQNSIGYVPQQIYLADDTVAANIAFGIDINEIDQQAVETAAKIANLHTFVKNELPQQYQTTIGERGVRLSGGQRQRIGIARALYLNPQVLILDEATSALDNLTEQAIMEELQHIEKNITIIIVAHRLSTVRKCNNIFLLDKGRLKGHGTFEELTQSNDTFRAMTLKH
jgi:ABC-type multidrug transport system fused ATPase/permease subunit